MMVANAIENRNADMTLKFDILFFKTLNIYHKINRHYATPNIWFRASCYANKCNACCTRRELGIKESSLQLSEPECMEPLMRDVYDCASDT